MGGTVEHACELRGVGSVAAAAACALLSNVCLIFHLAGVTKPGEAWGGGGA